MAKQRHNLGVSTNFAARLASKTDLVSKFDDELPDGIVDNLLAALGRYPDLVEAFARTPSYAMGAHCFRALLDRRIENYKQTNPG
jgi:hypothetical protein